MGHRITVRLRATAVHHTTFGSLKDPRHVTPRLALQLYLIELPACPCRQSDMLADNAAITLAHRTCLMCVTSQLGDLGVILHATRAPHAVW